MGEVKDKVTKRSSSRIKTPIDAGLLETAEQLRDELSRCTRIKDDDVIDESDDLKAENIRKAAQLRAAHALVTHVCALLEDY